MMASSIALSPPAMLPPLPALVTTKHRAIFDPRSDDWIVPSIVQGKISFRFGQLEKLSETLKHRIKLGLIHYATTSSESHFRNIGDRFWVFYDSELSSSDTVIDAIDLHHFINYRSKLDRTTEWKLGLVRILFVDMMALGYGGCSDEALRYLQGATIKGNVKGTSIRTRDPEAGTFSDSELLSIQAALNDAYASGDIPTNCGFRFRWSIFELPIGYR